MNIAAIKRLRKRLTLDQVVLGLWVTLEAPAVTEIAVAADLDWIVIDAEHGHLDWQEIVDHLRAASRAKTAVLVRLSENSAAAIKRALDLGADGIVIPGIETESELRRAISYAHYPPAGVRGIGADRATTWGKNFRQHVLEAEQHVLIIPILETITARRNLGAISQVDGVEILFFGPADYSASAGYAGEWEGPGVAEEILAMKDQLRTANKHCGIVCRGDDDLRLRMGQGFRMLGIGQDTGLLMASIDRLQRLAHSRLLNESTQGS